MGAFQSAVNSAISSVSQIAGINKLIQKRAGTPTGPQSPSAPAAPTQSNMQAESAQSQAKKIATKSSRDASTAKRMQKTEYSAKLQAATKSELASALAKTKTKKSTLSDADLANMVKKLLGNGKKN